VADDARLGAADSAQQSDPGPEFHVASLVELFAHEGGRFAASACHEPVQHLPVPLVVRRAVAVELAGYGRSHVHSQHRHRGQEEALDVVAAQDADHVGTRGFEAAFGLGESRMDAEGHVMVLRLRADQELGGVGQGGGMAEC
jgi:hypothetical protein